MGLRTRLKRVIFGPKSTPEPRPTPSVRPASSEPTASSARVSPATAKPASVSPIPSPTPSTEAANIDPKVRQHRNRTISALLQLATDNGGTASLGDMHDLAEKRYFIAHKAFSDLMEEMVEQGVFAYDWGTQVATVTEVGQQFLMDNPPRRRKDR